jgi:pyruvate dehydrogenase E1 component
VIDYTRRSGAHLPFKPNTAYVNTIAAAQEREYPGDRALERRIEAYIRWNAMAMVVQANRESSEYGGHIASYASAATLYEVGFNHFWRAPDDGHPGDMVFIQGHSAPRISSVTSARRSAARACRPIPTRGSCRISGSSPPSRWVSGR